MGNPASGSPGQSGALSDLAHRKIAELIQKKELKGGDAVLEQALAERLGISRTPLREALERLEGQGMILRNSGRSYVVRHVDMGEYMQSLKVRLMLEPEAAAAAAGHVPPALIAEARAEVEALHDLPPVQTERHWASDDQMHTLYTRHCGNDVLYHMIESLRVTTRLFEIAVLDARVSDDLAEHMTILDALEAPDAAGARKATRTHLKSLMNYSLNLMR